MDERLRRAEREADPTRLKAMRERAGIDPFAEGPILLTDEIPVLIALANGGGCLASLRANGRLTVWDVAEYADVHEREEVEATSVVARFDPLQVLWVNARGLHVETEGVTRTTFAAPEGTVGAALSSDGEWVGFVGGDRVELHRLDAEGRPTGEPRHVVLEQPEGFGQSDHDYEAELTRLSLVSGSEGPRFAALGAEASEEYCCSGGGYYDHYRLRYANVLFAGGADGDVWSVRESSYPGNLPEEIEEALATVPTAAPPVAAVGGRVYLPGGPQLGLCEAIDPYDFPDVEWEGATPLRVLAVHPEGELLLCNQDDELVLLRRDQVGKGTYVDAFVGHCATFSPDGRHMAWVTECGVSVAPLEFFLVED